MLSTDIEVEKNYVQFNVSDDESRQLAGTLYLSWMLASSVGLFWVLLVNQFWQKRKNGVTPTLWNFISFNIVQKLSGIDRLHPPSAQVREKWQIDILLADESSLLLVYIVNFTTFTLIVYLISHISYSELVYSIKVYMHKYMICTLQCTRPMMPILSSKYSFCLNCTFHKLHHQNTVQIRLAIPCARVFYACQYIQYVYIRKRIAQHR